MKGGGRVRRRCRPRAAPSPLPPPTPPSPPPDRLPPSARLPACLHSPFRAQARVAISGMPAAHFTVASSVAAAPLAVRGRRTCSAYLLEDLLRRPHRRLVAGDRRVLHGHRGRECGAPLRCRPVGASHSSTYMTHLLPGGTGRSRCHCHVSARPRHRPDRRHRRSCRPGVRPGHVCARSPTRRSSGSSPSRTGSQLMKVRHRRRHDCQHGRRHRRRHLRLH